MIKFALRTLFIALLVLIGAAACTYMIYGTNWPLQILAAVFGVNLSYAIVVVLASYIDDYFA